MHDISYFVLYYIIDILIFFLFFYNLRLAAGERGGQDGQRPRRREG